MINRTHDATQELPVAYQRRAWMDERGITNIQIAGACGVTPSRVSTMLRKGRAPRRYIAILSERFGMPENLLPAPSREKPGPISAKDRQGKAEVSATA
ncbi:helix-turn-helix domain-containing protein [Desulfovibrio oxyclinae]|uniref:helix-turn-helix domain-containing protein n=1 Tax=Desulfovibrio oxyclinae TaxID=63560 RepID=UPI0003805F52|nr:helix-turn-helix transcriptional regulator [Desulfovibrio oxyclinae]